MLDSIVSKSTAWVTDIYPILVRFAAVVYFCVLVVSEILPVTNVTAPEEPLTEDTIETESSLI
jgi:hypothetical protein